MKDKELIEKYNEILDKVHNTSKNVFDSEPVYEGKDLKLKTEYYEGKIKRRFYYN